MMEFTLPILLSPIPTFSTNEIYGVAPFGESTFEVGIATLGGADRHLEEKRNSETE
jgi:hypothetical protein